MLTNKSYCLYDVRRLFSLVATNFGRSLSGVGEEEIRWEGFREAGKKIKRGRGGKPSLHTSSLALYGLDNAFICVL
jgi:hypothetical protein